MEGFCLLASGSRGNCCYLGTKKTKLLIDAGLSGRATEEKLATLGLSLGDIDGILISHEHRDHIQGLKTLAFRYKIPILANAETAKGIYRTFYEMPTFKIFTRGDSFVFGDIEIHPFTIQHDTVDPVAFTLKIDDLKVGICTDLGTPTTLVKRALRGCHYLIVEANHEPSMVHASSRPETYKTRVLGKNGHLSNDACANLLAEVLDDKIRHIHLAHLSQECNSPRTAWERVRAKIGEAIPLAIAQQEQMGERILFS